MAGNHSWNLRVDIHYQFAGAQKACVHGRFGFLILGLMGGAVIEGAKLDVMVHIGEAGLFVGSQ
jgi:hypothetical protein